MTNLVLWVVTTIVYSGLSGFVWPYFNLGSDWQSVLKRFGIVALLCLPVNVNDYVFTVLGNAVGEKGVYSLCSVYQESEKGNVVSIVGLTAYQKAKKMALVIVGVVGFQQGGEDTGVVAGAAGFQKTLGLISEEDKKRHPERDYGSFVIVGIAVCQVSVENCTGGLAIVFYQKAKKEAVMTIGVSGYQRGDEIAVVFVGVGLYQRSGEKTRVFGTIMPLKAEK